jgi:two-component system KDP operon response regulator KdpE
MTGSRVLVIDDETAIRRLLRISLEPEGYILLEASEGKEGLVTASTQRPDLIILDLGLPDIDGMTVLKRLREWSKIPVIDKVTLLDAGADDYLTKPFSVPELLARIRAALRHTQPSEMQAIFCSGHLEIDLSARTVSISGKPVKLTVTEYDILRLLVRYAGKVVTQGHLLKEIWGPHATEQTQYLRVYIGQLRKKLEKDPPRPELILTEPGVGYRLIVIGR